MILKTSLPLFLIITALATIGSHGSGLLAQPAEVWQPVADRGGVQRANIVGPFAVARLNKAAYDAAVAQSAITITLPLPDGTFGKFTAVESPILAPELAADFPNIRTYAAQGTDDPSATARFGWTDFGFHAIVLSRAGTAYIDPVDASATDLYLSVYKADLAPRATPFICTLGERGAVTGERLLDAFPITHGTTKRTYTLALAATGEYTMAAGGTKNAALSRMTTTVNRVNGIYERDLAVTMTLVTGTPGDTTALIYTNGDTDPYTNNSGSTLLNENQANLDAVVGNGNYDIGHVFSTGGGGVAGLGVVCNAAQKGRGVTGSQNPTGDAFDVDFVAHEIGHQFAGNHTFNGLSGNCGTRSANNAYEVGSGSTIQAYAGICSAENLQSNTDDYFTVESLNEMTAFITDEGAGGSCGTAAATGNTVPTVAGGADYTIPISTPFVLTATGSDADGDSLTYAWEQYNLGPASNSVASASTDDGSRPIMRSYAPASSPSRTFPKLTYILNNANTPPQTYTCGTRTCLTGEILPTTSRTLRFHVTARDNRSAAGTIATDEVLVTSTTAAGPFVVTAPNTAVTLTGGTATTITWDVANTSAAPVSAANVRILWSTDGGNTFPTVLAASTPNDGSHTVTIPNSSTVTGRVKVEAVGNIFFDISNANLTVMESTAPVTFTDDPLVAGTTVVKALHVTEMRDAINVVRSRYGLSAATWTDTLTAGSTVVKGVHLTEMRTALAAVYTARSRPQPTYTNPTITAQSTVITAVDVSELRAAIIAIY